MKKTFSILLFLFVTLSCGNKESDSLASLLSNGDLKTLEQEKVTYRNKIQELEKQLGLIDEAIATKTNQNNFMVVSATSVNTSVFSHFISFQGTLKSHKNLVLYAEVPGILKRLNVKEGQVVKKGTLLGVISDSGMNDQLAQLKLQAALAKTAFERQSRLWGQKIGSEMQFLEAKTRYESLEKSIGQMEAQLAKTKIYAPFSGVIDDIITETGSNVNPGVNPILRIVNLNDMYVTAEIPEVHIVSITPNKAAQVYIPVLGATYEGAVSQIGNFINPNNRSFRVDIPLENKDKLLKPNMTVEVTVRDYSNPEALVVATKNVFENAQGDYFVYKLEPDPTDKDIFKIVKSKVSLGITYGNEVEVVEGLQSGDQIVVDGARSVRDQQRVRIISQS